jgi:hypothetical protein
VGFISLFQNHAGHLDVDESKVSELNKNSVDIG